jgi:hypothetical protein
MVDRYTKAVLTVIALALIGTIAGQAIPAAKAQRECGQDYRSPCFLVVLNCTAVAMQMPSTSLSPMLCGR